MKLRERFRRFWIGRNGVDQLYMFLFWAMLALTVIRFVFALIFQKWWVDLFYIPIALLIGWALFRSFSRNIYKRQRENRAYMKAMSRFKNFFVLKRNRFRDRKTHIYRKCPKCKNILRLPKIKGKHTVCCPCCKNRFDTNV